MDVEREARSHLRPLKRQAEAAERTAKLVNETNELRARIVADELRAQQADLAAAESKLIEVRSRRDSVERRFEEVRARRTAIEERIAAGEEGRRIRSELIAEVRAATERVRARAEATEHAERELRERARRAPAEARGARRGPRRGGGASSGSASWRPRSPAWTRLRTRGGRAWRAGPAGRAPDG